METTWLVVLLRLCVQIFAGPIYLLWYLGIWGPLCKKFFPYFMASVSVDYNKRMFVKKKELFSNLNDFARPAGTLRLLEIGTGTGTNFQFYPTGCRITCTDPNPNFDKFLAESLSQNPHLQVERCLVTPAEDLHEIPDASVDVVVCTLVLCSVKSIEGVVVEVLRVLRPGGAFYFLEHVADAPSSWTLFWQQVCEPTWRVLFDGCHLTRETWKELEKAGFSEVKLWHLQAPLTWNLIRPHIMGYAVK
ncbi:methyltransferase-like protein 7A isoform X3 [Varanus komodoensis]|uniref:Methyltransferase type 11 domain-containing protein n=1 Tax=Varanus komodoensis TaxID=61221 RepID=A0A8D2KRA9_VARKO|nr:methyltransferase-like protein 7A isoform X3 [Varanus komodoensis]